MSNGSKSFTEEDAAAIRNLFEFFCQAIVDRDRDAYLDACTKDVIHIPPGQPVFVGKDSYRAYLENVPRSTSYTAITDEVYGDGDLAHSFGTVTFKNENVDDYSARVIGIFRRKSDGTWKAERDIWNSETPSSP